MDKKPPKKRKTTENYKKLRQNYEDYIALEKIMQKVVDSLPDNTPDYYSESWKQKPFKPNIFELDEKTLNTGFGIDT